MRQVQGGQPGLDHRQRAQMGMGRQMAHMRDAQRVIGFGRAQPDPAGHVVDAEVLWAAVATLPPRQRAAVVLRFYEDLPDARAADALGCSTGAYRVLVHRGVAALRGQTGLGDAPLPDTSDRSPKGALR